MAKFDWLAKLVKPQADDWSKTANEYQQTNQPCPPIYLLSLELLMEINR
jgi:hypothetical protein